MNRIERGQILKDLRTKKGLKQSDLANALNITQQAYQRYENGTSEPNNDGLAFLADFYGVTTDYLLGREKLPEPVYSFDVGNMEESFINAYKQLDEDMRYKIFEFLQDVVEGGGKKNAFAENVKDKISGIAPDGYVDGRPYSEFTKADLDALKEQREKGTG